MPSRPVETFRSIIDDAIPLTRSLAELFGGSFASRSRQSLAKPQAERRQSLRTDVVSETLCGMMGANHTPMIPLADV